MKIQFVAYNQSLELKKLGFDEPCLAFYVDTEEKNLCCVSFPDGQIDTDKIRNTSKLMKLGRVTSPTKSQVFSWFESNYGLYVEIGIDKTMEPKFWFQINKFIGNPQDLVGTEWGWNDIKIQSEYLYYTREDCESNAIDELIKIIKEEKEGFISINDRLPEKNRNIIAINHKGEKIECFRCACKNKDCLDFRCPITGSTIMIDVKKWKYNMGSIADSMICGGVCSICGVYLNLDEEVYSIDENSESYKMPDDGKPIGFPVMCKNCKRS